MHLIVFHDFYSQLNQNSAQMNFHNELLKSKLNLQMWRTPLICSRLDDAGTGVKIWIFPARPKERIRINWMCVQIPEQSQKTDLSQVSWSLSSVKMSLLCGVASLGWRVRGFVTAGCKLTVLERSSGVFELFSHFSNVFLSLRPLPVLFCVTAFF